MPGLSNTNGKWSISGICTVSSENTQNIKIPLKLKYKGSEVIINDGGVNNTPKNADTNWVSPTVTSQTAFDEFVNDIGWTATTQYSADGRSGFTINRIDWTWIHDNT